ncbi:MAG: hypothetical protein KJ936_08660 [Proteobacteria bacterium]|nr:hypothetical protein [Pseudomonadota bacterium]
MTFYGSVKDDGKKFQEVLWSAFLKLGDGNNGIDIDDAQYNSFKWFVVVHDMKESSREVRQQAEHAFDNVFGKPVASGR